VRLAQPPSYDLALIDLRMPDQSGLDLVREARRRGLAIPPFIMISGAGDEETAIATLKLGAADYVVKREGYLLQLPSRIDLAIASDELARNNEDLRVELTHRKQAEEALRLSEARFKAIFEEAPLGVALIDSLTGHIHAVNPMFARIVGRTREEMTAIDWMSITHPEDIQKDLDQMARLNTGEIEGFQMEKRYVRRDGSTVWIRMTIAKVIVDERTSPRHLCMIEDITGRKKAEETLASAHKELALTSRLAALGTLVAGVAHEINNPLAAALSDQDLAMGAVQKLRDRLRGSGPLDREAEVHHLDEVVEELGEAQEAGRRIERIVKDLKVFGRPNQKNARERIRLIDVVDLAMRWLPATIHQTAIVTVENGGAPDVVATAGQITQVVVNLVTNAANAAPDGVRGVIVIRVGPGTPGMARLEVIDHGSGIDPAVMARIFDPFFTTAEVGKGTGLGLSICHSIVTNHGGTLTATSTPGSGSTFRVDLPAATEP
jgi:PAS domain S-box-containing protein